MSSDLVLKPTFSAVFNVEGLVFKFNGYQLKLLKMYRGKGPRCTRRQGRPRVCFCDFGSSPFYCHGVSLGSFCRVWGQQDFFSDTKLLSRHAGLNICSIARETQPGPS